jgi:3-oxoacyl-[acyl-carrier protein] reductase
MKRLEGQVAIVTGAGQGIGRGLAIGLAQEGAAVVVAEVNQDNAARVEREIKAAGNRALAVQTDVSSEKSVNEMVGRGLKEFGRVDILVNNAGIFPHSVVEEMAEEEWDRVIGVNLVGCFLCAKAVVPKMIENRKGSIIGIASGLGIVGQATGAHYSATKAGIIGFTKSLAQELAPHGITVNAICPGVTDTAQPRARMNDEQLYAMGRFVPLGGRIGQPEDIVGPVVFLASDAARFVTGQTLQVNGGSLMR